jgi:hypothetical protein
MTKSQCRSTRNKKNQGKSMSSKKPNNFLATDPKESNEDEIPAKPFKRMRQAWCFMPVNPDT